MRKLPGWALLQLRYVAVAVFPALIVPLFLWPDATGGMVQPERLIAAVAAFLVGYRINVVRATSPEWKPFSPCKS